MRITIISLCLVACASAEDSGSGPPPRDSASTIDSGTPPADAAESTDASLPDDAAVTADNAAHLGELCNASTACPAGYECLSLAAGATDMFCTLPCGGSMDTTTCGNGYPGEGTPGCFLADDPAMPTVFFCAIACGPEVPVPSDGKCPGALTCGDVNMNGQLDLCSN